MGDNFSTKEFVENNIRYFQFIKDKTELMTLGYITYQKLQVAGDGENEMIVFTDGNKWYKTPYTKEMYKIMAQINSSIFEENRIKKFVSENIKTFPIPTQKEFWSFGNAIYENLTLIKDGNDFYSVFSIGNNFYKIPDPRTKENDIYAYLKQLNDQRDADNDIFAETSDTFYTVNNPSQLLGLGDIIFENLKMVEKDGISYIIFSSGPFSYKMPCTKNTIITNFNNIDKINKERIGKKLQDELLLRKNWKNTILLNTREDIAATGLEYFCGLQVAFDNEKYYIAFSNKDGTIWYKYPYDQTVHEELFQFNRMVKGNVYNNQNFEYTFGNKNVEYAQSNEAR